MIEHIQAADIPANFFNDPYHHIIARCLVEYPRTGSQFLRGPGPSYGVWDAELGFSYSNPTQTGLSDWAQWLMNNRVSILAGETRSHYQLVSQLGQLLPEEAPLKVFFRYELQDFCIHTGDIPAVVSTAPVKKAVGKDASKLYHLYQRSENMQIRSLESLQFTLEHNRLYFMQKMGKPVSAALTHCESYNSGLIGGVYTPAAFRGRRYAQACMQALMESLKQEAKTPCLFYEQNNQAARKLYQNLGFQRYGEWILIELTYQEATSDVSASESDDTASA